MLGLIEGQPEVISRLLPDSYEVTHTLEDGVTIYCYVEGPEEDWAIAINNLEHGLYFGLVDVLDIDTNAREYNV